MGWFERIAAQDLKLRLIVGPAVITFATALVAGVFVLGPERGPYVGGAVGLVGAALVGRAIARRL